MFTITCFNSIIFKLYILNYIYLKYVNLIIYMYFFLSKNENFYKLQCCMCNYLLHF